MLSFFAEMERRGAFLQLVIPGQAVSEEGRDIDDWEFAGELAGYHARRELSLMQVSSALYRRGFFLT